jgi:outer membrane biosynthesis protein TonB
MFSAWHACGSFPCLASVQLGYWLAWAGSLVLSIALVFLMWTRWGHSRPLQKCAALSLLVHLVLAFLTMTVRIVSGDGGGGGGGSPIHVRIVQEGSDNAIAMTAVGETASAFAPPALLDVPPTKEEKPKPNETEAPAVQTTIAPKTVEKPEPESKKQVVDASNSAQAPTQVTVSQAPIASQPAKSPATPSQVATQKSATTQSPAPAIAATKPPVGQTTPADTKPSVAAVGAYSLRNASDRLSLIEGQGGNAKTEAAVVAALNWLAAAQSRDGRWSANQFGAGQEQMVLGQDRGGAGRNADTGVSALALLAFLGAGHSHLQGEYRETVHRGIDFLLRSQAADGSLFGDATLYAQMYCHSMATFALAEDQAMSGDRRLRTAVTNAVNFSLAAQNTGTGGWRYRPGDSGDTSQLGWQVMALASAKRAGMNVPDQTWNRVDRFLRSVRRGNFGGLASYRPDSPTSTSMTAEALYCHLVLEEMSGLGLSEQAVTEATNQVLGGLPTEDHANLYYWYYATLALHHRQQSSDDAASAWRTWNDALTGVLLTSQVSSGGDAGSWNANCMWGGYGGRIYTTAMATMCLEVYYRYAPAQKNAASVARFPETLR